MFSDFPRTEFPPLNPTIPAILRPHDQSTPSDRLGARVLEQAMTLV